MNYTDLRLKVRRFFRKYARWIYIIIIFWLVVFMLNKLFILNEPEPTAQTSYTPSVSVIDSTAVPKKEHTEITDLINEYVTYCNNNDFDKAYNMLSSDCRRFSFNNDFDEFRKHLYRLMPTAREYSVQSYSNPEKDIYIYQVNYFNDMLASGLTNSTYRYTTEKMTFKEDNKGNYEMSVGDFYNVKYPKAVAENEYLKVEVTTQVQKYEEEIYTVKIKNRNYDNFAVISDLTEGNEILLQLPNETRNCNRNYEVILGPGEEQTFELNFSKFVDDKKESKSITFSDIRMMKDYQTASKSYEEIENDKVNSTARFSLGINVNNY
ncbi:MAG: hypothetical protein K6D97_03175 [Clostridia bacterium]|nr:hypothetical protein [Clostridia bacterium]